MYYLESRYYSPEWGRFINADAIAGQVGELLSHNVFAYCINNPVNKFDEDGFMPSDNKPLGGDGGIGGGGAAELWGLYQLAKIGAGKVEQVVEEVAPKVSQHATNVINKASGIIAKTGTKVTGFVEHGVNRVIGDGGKCIGVKPQAILDALKNPLKVNPVKFDDLGRPSQRLIGRLAEVVLNPDTGRIISVNPTSSSKAARLIKLFEGAGK